MAKTVKFIPAIELPDGSKIATLEDAARHIMALPPATRKKPEWEFAGYEVVAAIEGRSIEMMARMAFMRALEGVEPSAHHVRREPKPGVKDPVYRPRKRQDPWRR